MALNIQPKHLPNLRLPPSLPRQQHNSMRRISAAAVSSPTFAASASTFASPRLDPIAAVRAYRAENHTIRSIQSNHPISPPIRPVCLTRSDGASPRRHLRTYAPLCRELAPADARIKGLGKEIADEYALLRDSYRVLAPGLFLSRFCRFSSLPLATTLQRLSPSPPQPGILRPLCCCRRCGNVGC